MNSLVKSKFCRTYSPQSGNHYESNALSQIKQMLLSRSSLEQKKAVSLVLEMLSASGSQTEHCLKIANYFISADICVFLSNAMSNYDWTLIRDIVTCFKLLSKSPNFYCDDHSGFVVSSLLRVINGYIKNNKNEIAVNCCLYFVSDIFYRMITYNQPSIISTKTVYNVDQIFELLRTLPEYMIGKTNTYLATGLVIDAIVSHDLQNTAINFKSVENLSLVIEKWLPILCSTMNDLVDASDVQNSVDSFYGIICHSCSCCLRLCSYLKYYTPKANFVQKVITNEEDILSLRVSAKRIGKSVYVSIINIVEFTKEHHDKINNSDYLVFLKFLNSFLVERMNAALLPTFSEILVGNGYLQMLPKSTHIRNDRKIGQMCLTNLCEILGCLSKHYLGTEEHPSGHDGFVKELQYGLKEICNDSKGLNNSKVVKIIKPNSILIYLYFFCLSVDNPQEVSGTFLPYLIQSIMSLPKSQKLPLHVVKCLWLLFSMASMSCSNNNSIEEKVLLSKANSRLMKILAASPMDYYTHHPSVLLWSFSHQSINKEIQNATLSKWLEMESELPDEILTEWCAQRILIELILNSNNKKLVENCTIVMKRCMDEVIFDEELESVALDLWNALPGLYSKFLLNPNCVEFNLKSLVMLATEILPLNVDQSLYQKLSLLLMLTISKLEDFDLISQECIDVLRLSLVLAMQVLHLAKEQGDDSVLITFTNRKGFLPNILSAIASNYNDLCCTALDFLSNIVHSYSELSNKSATPVELNTTNLLSYLCRDDDRKTSKVLKLIYAVLNCSPSNTIALLGPCCDTQQTIRVLKTVMFRLQVFCCKKDSVQSASGWKTLNSLLKYTIHFEDDEPIVALTTTPWTLILIQSQLQMNTIGPEFLEFVKNWLGVFKVLMKNKIVFNVTESNLQLFKYNMVFRTFNMLQKCLLSDEIYTDSDGIKILRNNILSSISGFYVK